MQKLLSAEQVAEFRHEVFVEDQVRHFRALVGSAPEGVVVDVGGGCGHFARALMLSTGRQVRVLDLDPASVEICRAAGVPALVADALTPPLSGDEEGACFNLVLHHLVDESDVDTGLLQLTALRVWARHARWLFVNEYVYDSFAGDFSGRLIYAVTRNRLLSTIARAVAWVVPPLRANTLGVGVRFRSRASWLRLFEQAGFEVSAGASGRSERVALSLRLLLIRDIRRDSFMLRPRPAPR